MYMFISNILFLTTIGCLLLIRFCVFGYRNLFLILISSCMRPVQDSISMWYHIVVYRFSHRPWTAHKCQRQSFRHTMHHEASLRYKVRNGRGWHAEVCIYLCVYCVHVQMYLNVDFDATAWTKRMHDAVVSRATHPIFSVRWSVSCRQLNMDSSWMYVH